MIKMKPEIYYMIQGLLNFTTVYCGNRTDAEDILQDITLKIIKKIEWFETLCENDQCRYLTQCVKNKVADRSKRNKAAKRNPYFHGKPILSVQPVVFVKMELEEVIQKMSERKNICDPLLLYTYGYTFKEISAMTGESINTILGRCRYAREFLRA